MASSGVKIRGEDAMKYVGKTLEQVTLDLGRRADQASKCLANLDPASFLRYQMLQLTDDYTLYLLVGAGIAYVVHKLALPRALLHPLLLGRQAHVSQVRNPGESAIYRNYGLGASPVCATSYLVCCYCSSRSSSQRRRSGASRRYSISYVENRHKALRRGGSGVLK